MNTKVAKARSLPAVKTVTPRSRAAAASPPSGNHSTSPVVMEDGVFKVENWLPYEFSFVANRVSAALADVYKTRFGFTVAGWRVVAALGTHPGISPKELAEMIGMDQVSITRAVASLAKLGMVTRRTNTADRRSLSLRLSVKGQAAYDEVMPLAQEIEAILIEPLSQVQVEGLRKAMALVVQRAAEALKPPSEAP